MLIIDNNKIEYKYLNCQQCGVCESVCPKGAISTKLLDNGTHEIIVNHDLCVKCQKCVRCCPANRDNDYSGYFEEMPNKRYFLGYNKDNRIRSESSSGSTCKTLIIDSLKQGLVDGVYTLKKLEHYPSGEGEFYTKENIPAYDDLSNSVYHSVMIGTNLKKVQKCDRLMIVGTSCQLYAMEKALRGKYKELIKVCIFCKQQKTLESTRFLAKAMGAKLPKKTSDISTCYRGIGWPGIVRVMDSELSWNRAAQLPFGRRLWTVGGCNICGDPFGKCGNTADITLMDPWSIRQQNDLGETLVTVHTERGLGLMKACQDLVLEEKNYDSVKPALGEKDISRKQQLVPFFRGDKCCLKVRMAGKGEQLQRKYLQTMATLLPRLPFIFYRVMFRIPDLRNIILKH